MSDGKEFLQRRITEALADFEVDELEALSRMVRAIERRRRYLPDIERRRDRARTVDLERGLRELRDATSWSNQPELVVIDGGGE